MTNAHETSHTGSTRKHEEGLPSAPQAAIVPRPTCDAMDDDEPMGGDPPCWAHLFEDEDEVIGG